MRVEHPLQWKCVAKKVPLGGVAALLCLISARVPAQIAVQEWVQRYSSSGSGLDQPSAIAVDGSGNVIVTGRSKGAGGYDYVTLKYSAAGVPLWTNRYSGQTDEQPAAVAVDASDDVVVTGFFSAYGASAYGTIKYSRSGVPLWTNRYYGPGNFDYATAVALDHSGNVFVTGSSGDEDYALYHNLDGATIKYSSAGVPLWTNRYNGDRSTYPTAIAVDGNGDVIVTGYTIDANRNSSGSATIKYSGAGAPLWTNRNLRYTAKALAVDGNTNVFVAGYWYNVDPDYTTIAYSSAGVPLWTNRYNGVDNRSDSATSVAVDRSGSVFVTGSSYSFANGDDYATIKYSDAGVPLWTNLYSGPGSGSDKAVALAVDGNGDVIVTGYSLGSSSSNDIATVKYSGAGVPLWTNRYNGPANSDDRATALSVDGSGNIYVTGYSTGSGTGYDYVTIKYSSAGVPLLTIARTTTNTLAVSWPSPGTDFTLQQNTNAATTNWTLISSPASDDGTNKTVIVDPAEGNIFYRLARP